MVNRHYSYSIKQSSPFTPSNNSLSLLINFLLISFLSKKRYDVFDIDDFILTRAGELKKALRIALPDCYVIATTEKVDLRGSKRR